jgi:predicted anti-sigma-YlaC factor YlaD
MTSLPTPLCEEVRVAAMARLDGEPFGLSSDEIEMHIAVCRPCAMEIAALSALHADLTRADYERLELDLWPTLEPTVNLIVRRRREGRTILALAAVLVVWRLAQLLLDLPGPVLNSVVPLAIVMVVLRRLTGDPFAIQPSTHQLQ